MIKDCQSIDSSKTIAILVRAKSHLDHIIPALEKEGINWIGNDLNLLSDRESVIDCISLTRVFINPLINSLGYPYFTPHYVGFL